MLTCEHCDRKFVGAIYPGKGHKIWWPTGVDQVDAPASDPDRYWRLSQESETLIAIWFLCKTCARDLHSWPYWPAFGYQGDDLQALCSRYVDVEHGKGGAARPS